jgi:hypothetical protein
MPDFFNWDWRMPAAASYRPSYREPPPARLTLEELLGMQEAFAPPPKPKPVSSIADLPADQRRSARLDSLWAGLAAMGAGASSGNWGGAAQGGVANLQDIQGRAIAEANARQEQDYATQVQAAQEQAAAQKQQQEKKALFGMYQEVAQGESEPFVQQAEAAARSGSMAELEKLREQKPQRAAARLKGYDPDAWDTNKRLQEELQAELERQAKQKEWEEVEKGRLEEEERIKAEALLTSRERQNAHGVLWEPRETPAEAAAKADAVERVHQRYSTTSDASHRRIVQAADGTWGVTVMDANGDSVFKPTKNQPVKRGGYWHMTIDNVPYIMDPERPELGWYESNINPAGTVMPPRGAPVPPPAPKTAPPQRGGFLHSVGSALGLVDDSPPKAPAPTAKKSAAPHASHVLNQAAADLSDGSSEAEVLALLQHLGPQDGFTPEQIFARAKALALAKRRGR